MNGLNIAFKLLEKIEAGGFKAYLVGGAVRDIVMGKTPIDYDIATSAPPDAIKEIFANDKQYLSGERYKTVAVIYKDTLFEITTFRQESGYLDHRHPNITENAGIESDILRRDFTINALYMDKNGKIFDPLGGKKDIENRIIRTVGKANQRFFEDALRILRGIRFASVLNFFIDPDTAAAMEQTAGLLKNISKERITAELQKAMTGDGFFNVYDRFPAVFSEIFEKPPVFSKKDRAGFQLLNGEERFYLFLARLNTGTDNLALSKKQKKTAECLKKFLNTQSPNLTRLFFEDEEAAALFLKIKKAENEEIILPENFIYKIADLDVSGSELKIPEKLRAKALQHALFAVADGKINNRKEEILEFIKKWAIDK